MIRTAVVAIVLSNVLASPAWSLSREAQEFIDISKKLEPLQCEKRKLRREIALAQVESRDTSALRERFAALDRDPHTAKLEKRLGELQPRITRSTDPEDLARLLSPRTRLVILNSPHNPTGGVLSGDDLDAIAAALRGSDVAVLSDEIYGQMLYEGEHQSIATRPGMLDRTILLDGFSKTFAMTGWRIGFGVFPAALVPQIERLVINSVSCTPAFTQRAAHAALDDGCRVVQPLGLCEVAMVKSYFGPPAMIAGFGNGLEVYEGACQKVTLRARAARSIHQYSAVHEDPHHPIRRVLPLMPVLALQVVDGEGFDAGGPHLVREHPQLAPELGVRR